VPSSPAKKQCYAGVLRTFLKAVPYLDPPLERCEIPFEGKRVVGYLQIPKGAERPPVVMHWGGVDGWKEDRYTNNDVLLKMGIACFTIDMPGAGENPCLGQEPQAERTFSAAMDYLAMRQDIDGKRIACMGGSFGGYWAAKMAYVEPKRLRASIVWGGGVHYFFQEDWLRESTNADSYLMDHDIARCRLFGVNSIDELMKPWSALSLKDQGWLDKPSCPMLIVNGKNDLQTPIADLYILLEHGTPKSARVFPGGHMGQTPQTFPTIVDWLKNELS
jgi:pimeloyl-ACP methyl ester carboxylesterase